ncbi:MAG TPA: hypothetical protein VLI04_00580 [Nocardioidaceae bacterium]|nr:hypothetical protein [Nocardioidaceae bacterium]
MTDFLGSTVVRRYATATALGAVLGALWVGVLSRGAMAIIAAANDQADGLVSDDGFEIGQFTLSGSLNLLFFGFAIGAFGGALYVALRGLRVGPGWFQVLSISLAPAIVALSMLVHPTGVDFTLLEPISLSLGLFLAVAWGYTLSVAVLVERLIEPAGFAETAPTWLIGLMLVASIPILPLVAALALGRFALHASGSKAAAAAWPARAALALVFALSVSNLVSDIAALA